MIPFTEDTRVKIPALVHLSRLGYSYLKKNKMINIDPQTNIFLNQFKEGISRINCKQYYRI